MMRNITFRCVSID